MNVKDKKPVSKSKLLTLIKDLDWRSVKAALEQNPDRLKHRGDKGANLLHLCCGIDIEKRGLSAPDSIKTAGVLLDATLDINREAFTEGEWKATPLWYAVGRGKNLELANYLLKRGADPEHLPVGRGLQRQPGRNPAVGSGRGRRGRAWRGDAVPVRRQVEPVRIGQGAARCRRGCECPGWTRQD